MNNSTEALPTVHEPARQAFTTELYKVELRNLYSRAARNHGLTVERAREALAEANLTHQFTNAARDAAQALAANIWPWVKRWRLTGGLSDEALEQMRQLIGTMSPESSADEIARFVEVLKAAIEERRDGTFALSGLN